jgi:hypothetical protein
LDLTTTLIRHPRLTVLDRTARLANGRTPVAALSGRRLGAKRREQDADSHRNTESFHHVDLIDWHGEKVTIHKLALLGNLRYLRNDASVS